MFGHPPPRRVRGGNLLVAAVVLATLAGVVLVTTATGPPPEPAVNVGVNPACPSTPAPAGSVARWCARGSLVHDDALLVAAARAWWATGDSRDQPPPGAPLTGVFAATGPPGQVGLTVVVLVAPRVGGGETVAYLTSTVAAMPAAPDTRLHLRALQQFPAGSAPEAIGFVDARPDTGDPVLSAPLVPAFALAAPGGTARLASPLIDMSLTGGAVGDPVAWVPQPAGAGAATTFAATADGSLLPVAAGLDDPVVRPVRPAGDDPARVLDDRVGDVVTSRGWWAGVVGAGGVLAADTVPDGWSAVTALGQPLPVVTDASGGLVVDGVPPDGTGEHTRVDLLAPDRATRIPLGHLARGTVRFLDRDRTQVSKWSVVAVVDARTAPAEPLLATTF
ncbi:hypothetical protein [Actinokineospora terrae]|uniref:Uncharacterized protein n=1 Tax=Actinokineospora terrae TaxID=155974 RepID=A0A1H9MA77_9PSEU|nr:hypothetical protein [Actinokineospora terrae]SER20660.1 hypothetical protein SAMN04487818_10254 [Actinokineospora terrae]